MPKMLADGGTEYDDGTIATESQQAKVQHGNPCPQKNLLGISAESDGEQQRAWLCHMRHVA